MSKTHLPCQDCGSSDALTIYDDGHTYCFSCGRYVPPPKGGQSGPSPKKDTELMESIQGLSIDIKKYFSNE